MGKPRSRSLRSLSQMRRLLYLGVRGMILLIPAVIFLDAVISSPAAEDKPAIEPLQHKGYVETIPGSKVSFEMMPIPGGTYRMGSPANESGRSADEGPQHLVNVRPFWMCKTEVRWDEFDLYFKPEEGGKKDETPQEKA